LSLGLLPKMIIQKLCCYAVALPDIEEAMGRIRLFVAKTKYG